MSGEEQLAYLDGARCQCGHVATMVCPDCGQPICEECARDITVPLWPQGLESLASGSDTFWFCQGCAPAEEQLATLAEQKVTEWAAQPVLDYYTDTGEEELEELLEGEEEPEEVSEHASNR